MAGAAGVEDSIWLSEILRRSPLTRRRELLSGEIFGWNIQVREHVQILTQQYIFQSASRKSIQKPRYVHFMFGADRDYWTLWTSNSEYFVIILIVQGF
jgi:hypothetical protein